VIATGGGAVLREENRRAMRQGGRVYLLERALAALPLDGRPLSSSKAALASMWKKRRPVYTACADIIIDNDSAPQAALNRAEEEFYEAARG